MNACADCGVATPWHYHRCQACFDRRAENSDGVTSSPGNALQIIGQDRDTWKARALKANADLEKLQHEIMLRGAGRATSEAHKAITMHRILVAWLKVPDLRLGQMLDNASCAGPAIGLLEDDFLADAVEKLAEESR